MTSEYDIFAGKLRTGLWCLTLARLVHVPCDWCIFLRFCTLPNRRTSLNNKKSMAVCEEDVFLCESALQNVSWSDIMDAEESEDPMALERLR